MMDMDRPIEIEGDLFGRQTDSDFYYPVFQCQPLDLPYQDIDYLQKKFEGDHLDNIIRSLSAYEPITDIPITNLLKTTKNQYSLLQNERRELVRRLKKTKLIQKRQRAKFRKNICQKQLIIKVPQKLEGKEIDSEESKKKKNRLSAQISRDRKKEYSKKIESENQELHRRNLQLMKDNELLKSKLNKSSNQQASYSNFSDFQDVLMTLGIKSFLRLSAEKKRKRTNKKENLSYSIPINEKQNQRVAQILEKQLGNLTEDSKIKKQINIKLNQVTDIIYKSMNFSQKSNSL